MGEFKLKPALRATEIVGDEKTRSRHEVTPLTYALLQAAIFPARQLRHLHAVQSFHYICMLLTAQLRFVISLPCVRTLRLRSCYRKLLKMTVLKAITSPLVSRTSFEVCLLLPQAREIYRTKAMTFLIRDVKERNPRQLALTGSLFSHDCRRRKFDVQPFGYKLENVHK